MASRSSTLEIVVTLLIEPLLRRRVGVTLNLEQRTEREARHSERASRRQVRGIDIRDVDLVECRPVRHVAQEHLTSDDILPAQAGALERCTDALESVLRLRLETRRQLAFRIDADLTRQIQ